MRERVITTLLSVTSWSRKNEKGEWEFNHLEDGHVPAGTVKPTPKHENHKSTWRKGEWAAKPVYLTADIPPRVVTG